MLSTYYIVCIQAPLADINNVYCNTSNTSVNTNGEQIKLLQISSLTSLFQTSLSLSKRLKMSIKESTEVLSLNHSLGFISFENNQTWYSSEVYRMTRLITDISPSPLYTTSVAFFWIKVLKVNIDGQLGRQIIPYLVNMTLNQLWHPPRSMLMWTSLFQGLSFLQCPQHVL